MLDRGVQLAYAYSYPLTADLPRISMVDRFVCIVDFVFRHFYVKTKGDFGHYLSLKNKKTVSTLRRKVRKVEETNAEDSSFEVYTSPEDFERFYTLAITVSERSYQQRLLGQGLPKTKKFKEELLTRSMKGEILGYILKVSGKPVAYNLCPIYGGNKALYDYTGYDPDYAKYSPGSVLQFKIIEDLFAREKIDYYDLCIGEGLHKELFATGHIFCGNIYFCKITLKNLSIFSIKYIISSINELGKKLLAFIGLERIVKKLIRRHA
jgi:CelD/BcsL family acetyltransferase involved in cellulose biosynthesis